MPYLLHSTFQSLYICFRPVSRDFIVLTGGTGKVCLLCLLEAEGHNFMIKEKKILDLYLLLFQLEFKS